MPAMRQKLKATPLMMILFKDVELLEHDAATQYKFNRFWAMFWFTTMVCVPLVPTLRHPFLSLLIMEASLWANFATHFGAMSAALAAKNTTSVVKDIAEDVGSVTENVEQIADVVTG
jgi:hypothetical protein